MRHLLSLFMLGVTVAAYAQYEGPLQPLQGIEYKAEAQASVSDGTTPLWLNANKYGLSSLEKTNGYLVCRNCTEKLCVHKKQLNRLWKQVEEYSARRIGRLKKQ